MMSGAAGLRILAAILMFAGSFGLVFGIQQALGNPYAQFGLMSAQEMAAENASRQQGVIMTVLGIIAYIVGFIVYSRTKSAK